MTTYRYVCPDCTAFIRSPDVRSSSDEADWKAQADDWKAIHVCGERDGDGVEDRQRHSERA